ncbi:MobQ family relaxase [Intestinimonas butyriciproducens]|uniref:MobQ family relaxase n=1 Tax=Intestinimonas butyriciproducens TaxID=1297617 RepID=UPI0018A8A20A|nr:MobQ family relaxase [Intestinimonas butyriciproducens]MDB7815934.1 MobA/MobL family protein [Intestinimonas butyriciproducens]MDB7843296.1 MobA/MobL family protein [Intestinimonas butyriciproducens]MDB7856956.1 MobA/MobL family protein [Intestinimonas butyriciproducens]
MALFHFHVTQIKRSAGQSIVTSAAYRAGEKLFSEYYGEVSDYTHKGGVVCTDILLPPQAPAEYQDRATLWNAVEKAERGKKAQLAYSFDIALQNELSLDENIALARQFVSEQLVGRGMIADFAIHQPDKEDGGIPNPHFHILCPIRPIEPDGKWGCKQRRRYRLGEDGNRIIGEDGKALFDAIPTTDWGDPATLEEWRRVWAEMVNAKFEEKGLTCRVDHRSYERQGVDTPPTIHEGVAVRQMEAKGITTDKGDFNRWVRKAHDLLRNIRAKIADLTDWIAAVKEELSKPQAPTLAALITSYYEGRNAGAWSHAAKIGNLRNHSEAVNFLTEKGIATLEDLEAHIAAQSKRTEAISASMKAKSDRVNELKELLRLVDLYRDTKPIYDEWKGIRWKGKREQFEREHENELRTFHMSRRKLDKLRSPAGKIPAHAWEQEKAMLEQEYATEYEQYKPIRDDLRRLQQVKRNADTALHQQEQTRQKRREAER